MTEFAFGLLAGLFFGAAVAHAFALYSERKRLAQDAKRLREARDRMQEHVDRLAEIGVYCEALNEKTGEKITPRETPRHWPGIEPHNLGEVN